MGNRTIIDWKKDSQSFNRIANLYDKFRPTYPEQLAERVIEFSRLAEDGKILEVGSGTGKATCLFARRGYSIHCVEPGANMAALAAWNLRTYPRVTFEIARFEQCRDRNDEFDLVISAQAFHWISKNIGYDKSALALKQGGTIALFWNTFPGFQGQVALDLEKIYREIVPGLDNPLPATQDTILEQIDDINQSKRFGPVTVELFPWTQTYQTREYTGLLNTFSDHLRLSEHTQKRLFEAVAAAINSQGGSIERAYVAVLYVAKKIIL
jgi:SAM-dependent methyltransferase